MALLTEGADPDALPVRRPSWACLRPEVNNRGERRRSGTQRLISESLTGHEFALLASQIRGVHHDYHPPTFDRPMKASEPEGLVDWRCVALIRYGHFIDHSK